MRDSEVKHWAANWRQADRIWGHESVVGRKRLRRRFELLLKYAGLRAKKAKSMAVLELGCGTGAYTELLAKTGYRLTATDLIPEFVNLTSIKVKKHKSVKVMRADATKLPFREKSFDAVVGNSILHHIPIEKVLSEIWRVLKPGGRLAFTEPNMLNPHIFLQKNVPLLKRLAGDTPDEIAFARWVLAGQLKRQGFVDVEVEPFDFLYPFMPISLVRPISLIGPILERIPLFREIAGSVIISAGKPKRVVSSGLVHEKR